MRISAWSSDVCSSDLEALAQAVKTLGHGLAGVAGERLGAEIDLDAGDHAGPGDLLHERRAVGGLLADGLVVEDDAGEDRKSTRLTTSQSCDYRMPSYA